MRACFVRKRLSAPGSLWVGEERHDRTAGAQVPMWSIHRR